MLTAKQNELLAFIDHSLRTTGVSPSFREMMAAVDLRSTAGVDRLIRALCERGHLRRIPNRARAMEVLKRPSGPGWEERISGGASAARVPNPPVVGDGALALRVLDRIVEGSPSWSDGPAATMSVPAALVGEGEHFVVVMSDDAMVGEGILPGDAVIVRSARRGIHGSMCLVQVPRPGHLVRRWSREGSMIRLDPSNRSYDPERFMTDAVEVHGIVAGVIRLYS